MTDTYLLRISRLENCVLELRDYKRLPLISHYQNPETGGIEGPYMSQKLVCEKIYIDKYDSIS